MKIGLDFGGVLANHLPTKITVAREQFGLDVQHPAQVTRGRLLPVMGSHDYAELVRLVGARTADFSVYPGARAVLTTLVDQGHECHVVSTQTNASVNVLEAFFKTHNLPIASTAVVAADVGKQAACRTLGVQAFIDDSLAVLESLRPLGVPLVLAVFADDYAVTQELGGIQVMRAWEEFLPNIYPQLL